VSLRFAQLLHALTEGAKELSFVDHSGFVGDCSPSHHEQISWIYLRAFEESSCVQNEILNANSAHKFNLGRLLVAEDH